MRDDSAAIDVADEHNRRSGGAGETHIGDIVRAQINLGGAARPLDDHKVAGGFKAREAFHHRRSQPGFPRLIIARFRLTGDLSAHDDLRAIIALRLEQHRIHIDACRQTRGPRLQGLRTADFAAIHRHGGVIRHILRLERRNANAAIGEGARQSRDDERFADVGPRALDHQRPAHESRKAMAASRSWVTRTPSIMGGAIITTGRPRARAASILA